MKQCPNPDCDNTVLYEDSEAPILCPQCNTKLENFSYVEDEEYSDEELENDGSDDYDEYEQRVDFED